MEFLHIVRLRAPRAEAERKSIGRKGGGMCPAQAGRETGTVLER